MPRLLESDAEFLTLNYDALSPENQAKAQEWFGNYRQQQADEGEPLFPTQEKTRAERQAWLRSMFEAPDKIDYDPGPMSLNPELAKMQHANMALLSARYQKEPAEVASRYDFLLNDYARQKLGASEDVDTAKFYALAQKDMQKVKLREDTQREGMSAALRGEDGVKALSAWQAKNADRAKDDAGLFMRGYQQALEQDGEMLPIADRLWKALESGTDKTGQNVQANMERGQVRQELGQMVEQLAGMKKAQRKSVYRSIAARIEAAGYDQKGFWSQMLGFLDQQLYAAGSSLTETGGIAADVATAVAGAQTRIPDTFDGSSVSLPVLSDEEQQALLRQRDYRERIGDVEGEIMQIISDELDPVKPTTGWMNETIETGLIKAPGAILPWMSASALLGPYGAGLVFTADFAAQNRRELVQSGMDADQARKIAVMAAPLQAAVESLSNMVSLGKFPAVQAALSRFTRPVGGASLVGRYVQNSLISGATEFIEEQVQDNVVVPAMQELLGALEKDVPEVDWSFYKTRAANATPELAATLLPMALVFGGVMTAADAKLSRTMTQNADLMMATGMDQAQAVEIASQPTHEQRIKKGAELWLQRKGTKASMEEAQKKLADQYRTLAADSAAAVKELEARGVLPRLLPMQGGEYRLTFNDGSTADFKTREEALGGIHVYIRDRMQRSTRALRETIDTLTKNLEQGREFALEISPEAMPADEAVKRGIISPQALQERAAQGAILDATTLIENSVLTGKALGDEETPLMLFGMSKNEWYDKEGRAIGMQRIKDDILRTTMRLWDGASPLTLIEEKTEGDAKVILSTPGKRQWMLDHLRAYEDASGDKLFTSDDNEQINDKQLIEAWSHMAQSYFVAAKDKVKGRTLGRYLRDIEEAELTAAMQGRASWWQAVVNRAQKLGELKAAGKLGADVVAELEKQLGIDSQVKHEQGAMQEAQNVANEVAQQVDTSGYSEATPGPNGETFSVGDGFGFENVDFAPRQAPRYLHATNLDSGNPLGLVVAARFPSGRLKIGKPGQIHANLGLSSQDEYELGFVTKDGRFIDREKGSKMWLDAMIERDKQRSLSSRAIPADASKVVQMPDGKPVAQETFSLRVTPAQDAEYMAAVEAGDMEKAQRMVDEAAKSAGYKSASVIHSTNAEFNSFGRVRWVSTIKGRSEVITPIKSTGIGLIYATQDSAYSALFGDKQLKLYHNISNPADLRSLGSRNVSDSAFDAMLSTLGIAHKSSSMGAAPVFERLNKGQHKKAMLEAGFDGFALRERSGDLEADAIAGFDSSQFKSADPVTRDESGNVIPLSQRFNPADDRITFSLRVTPAQDAEYMAAVKAGDMQTAQRMVDEAAFENGLEEWFHGNTKSFGGFSSTDLGVHLGAEDAAQDRLEQTGQTSGVINKYYVDIKNPVKLKYDPDTWQALDVWQALPKDIKDKVEDSYEYVIQDLELGELKSELQKLGFDGIKYPNAFEGVGDSILVFDKAQIKSADPVTRDESGNVIPLSQRFNPADDRITFSLRPGDFASRVEAMFLPFQRSPEARLVMARVAKDRALRLGNELIEKANVIRTIGSIDREARVRAALAEDKAVQDYLDGLTPAARQTLEWQPADLQDDPLIAAMLDFGKLMSKTTALQRGKVDLKMGDFDGAPWLPPSFYSKGAGIMPDQMAQAMFDAGLLPDAYTDTLWSELSKRIEATRKDKTAHREAVQAFKDAKKAARDAASKEADKWADNAKKKPAKPKGKKSVTTPNATTPTPTKQDAGPLPVGAGNTTGTPAQQPANPTPAPVVINRQTAEQQFNSPQGIDANAFGDFTVNAVESALKEGKQVTLITDGGNKRVPIVSVQKGMMRDVEGNGWGTLAMIADYKGGVEITNPTPAPVTPEPGKPGSRETTPTTGQREPVTPSIETPIDNAPAPLPQDLSAKLAVLDAWNSGGTVKPDAKKQAGSGKAQRDRIKAWLRVLDGILAASPPEVRARVGGFVKMAGIATDEAALRYLEDRVAKLDRELEKWLKKDATGSINRLFKKAAADYTAGKKAKGKLGPDEHYLFQRAEAASEMDAAALRGELAKLDALADDESLSDDQRALAVLERGIVELVGDMKNADSGRLFTAFDELTRLYSQGVVAWKAKQTARREARQAVRDALKADAGKSGVLKERQAMEKAMTTLFGKAKSAWLSVSSFSEVLRYAFGSKSQQATELIDGEREASNAYEDEQQAIADELESLFASMAGGKTLDGERLRFDMAQRTIKAGDVELSQFEAITALLMWRQEDGRRHMEGTFDENGQRTSGWSYDQAWIDEVEKQLTPEGRRVMAWLAAKYGSEHGELNALYRERHGVNLPAHDNYAPLTVKPMQAKAGEIVDPVSGAAVSGSILTPGSLRTRSRMAIAEPEFRDALQTFVAHKKQMGYWKAYYDLATDMQAVLGNRELMNSVEAAAGKEAVVTLRKWMDVLAQGGVRDASAGLAMNDRFQRMMNRAATVGLLGRVSTLLVQSTQLAAASVQMPVGAYLRRFGKLFGGQLDWKGAIQSAFIQRRIKTAPPIVRQAFENLANAKSPNEIKRATYNLGKLLSGTDGLFTGGTYAILLDYHRETGSKLGLTGADLEEHAHREAERATEEVAQPTRTATRSLAELTATNPLAKVSWAYASEARQKIALLGWAAVNFKADPVRFGKAAFLVFGVGGVMSQVLKNIWKEAKGDDDEEKWSPERLIKGSVVNALHGIPMMAEIMGEPGMFSSTAWAQAALDDLLKGEADLRDINTLLGTLGLFNDTAAGIAAMSNAGYDFAKIIEAAFSE